MVTDSSPASDFIWDRLAQASVHNERRAAFLETFREHQQNTKPMVEELGLERWAQTALRHLEELERNAVDHFSRGHYAEAIVLLEDFRALAHTLVTERKTRLAGEIRAAKTAFEASQAERAGRHIRHGLVLDPDNPVLGSLQRRVQVLGQVDALLEQARMARIGNRLPEEIERLRKVIELDPARKSIRLRIRELEETLKKKVVADALHKAHVALDSGHLAEAKKRLSDAKRMAPPGQDFSSLQRRIDDIEVEHAYHHQLSMASSAVERDDWKAAAEHYTAALQSMPHDQAAAEGLSTANRVIVALDRMMTTLAWEARLSTPQGNQGATEALRMATPYLPHSARLQALHDELTRKIWLYQQEVEVTVISDKQTHVVVRGVGLVGRTLRYTISLKPGNYRFEGSRENYKSVIIPVSIEPNSSPVVIEVVCNEPV